MSANLKPLLTISDSDITECMGPCGETFLKEVMHNIGGVRVCPDCFYEHPDVVQDLYDELKADMLSDDFD